MSQTDLTRPPGPLVAPDAVPRPARSGRSPARTWTLWVLRRVGLSVLTLWLVSVIVFLATSALGDPVRAILGKDFGENALAIDHEREGFAGVGPHRPYGEAVVEALSATGWSRRTSCSVLADISSRTAR